MRIELEGLVSAVGVASPGKFGLSRRTGLGAWNAESGDGDRWTGGLRQGIWEGVWSGEEGGEWAGLVAEVEADLAEAEADAAADADAELSEDLQSSSESLPEWDGALEGGEGDEEWVFAFAFAEGVVLVWSSLANEPASLLKTDIDFAFLRLDDEHGG